jgi:periplasmic divalent cation tolerance protein
MSPDHTLAAVIVLTTIGEAADATALGRRLVDERLAACVNILPVMTSIYRWKGAIEEDRERQLIIKTTSARVEKLRARLHELHPYEVPEFIVIAVEEGADAYLDWVGESVAIAPRD